MENNNVFSYKSPWSGEVDQIILHKRKYRYMDNLAVAAITIEGNPYSTFTVCLDYPLSEDDKSLAFIDINNNPGLDKWLEENNIATPTGHWGESGFCEYPEYRFNLDLLED